MMLATRPAGMMLAGYPWLPYKHFTTCINQNPQALQTERRPVTHRATMKVEHRRESKKIQVALTRSRNDSLPQITHGGGACRTLMIVAWTTIKTIQNHVTILAQGIEFLKT